MPDINTAVSLPPELVAVVKAKLTDPAFTHKDWSSDDLQAVRSFIRQHYRVAQRGRCAYCKRILGKQAAGNCHVEHLLSKSLYRAFIFEPKNLCAVCAECNTVKRSQETASTPVDALNKNAAKLYPRSADAFKVVHPHFDVYDEHIEILRDRYYVGKTPKGYFTVGACDLNAHIREFGWRPEFVDEGEAKRKAGVLAAATTQADIRAAIRDLQDTLLEF